MKNIEDINKAAVTKILTTKKRFKKHALTS